MIRKLKVLEKGNFKGLILKDGFEPVEVTYSNITENIINFSNGDNENGVCINCSDKPCFNYSAEEINTDILEGFPFNNDPRVCPSNAIILSETRGIEIKDEDCIGCGICVMRCPFGGITLKTEDRVPRVNNNPGNIFEITTEINDERRLKTYKLFSSVHKKTLIDKIKLDFSKNFKQYFFKMTNQISDLELILIRNLMLGVGILNKVAAKGNVDTRIDFLGVFCENKIPGESGMNGTDILGLPRRLLEDFAVLYSRYSIPREQIIPVIFLLEFPRKRSEYYEVITDIKNITGIEIKTLPVHFLLLSNLLNVKLSIAELNAFFFIDKNKQDFGDYAKRIISDIENIDDSFGTELYTYSK